MRGHEFGQRGIGGFPVRVNPHLKQFQQIPRLRVALSGCYAQAQRPAMQFGLSPVQHALFISGQFFFGAMRPCASRLHLLDNVQWPRFRG